MLSLILLHIIWSFLLEPTMNGLPLTMETPTGDRNWERFSASQMLGCHRIIQEACSKYRFPGPGSSVLWPSSSRRFWCVPLFVKYLFRWSLRFFFFFSNSKDIWGYTKGTFVSWNISRYGSSKKKKSVLKVSYRANQCFSHSSLFLVVSPLILCDPSQIVLVLLTWDSQALCKV